MKVRGLLLVVLMALVIVYAVYFWKTGEKGKSNLEVMVDQYAEAKVDLTKVNMDALGRIIGEHMASEGQAPASLQDLRRFQPVAVAALDAWGREIRYERLSDTSFRLTSPGPDGALDTEDDLVKEY
jgi:hypothetical protein